MKFNYLAVIFILGVCLGYSSIVFVSPTFSNGSVVNSSTIQANASIDDFGILSFSWFFNGSSYPFYNSSLVASYNFDNVSDLGENDTYVVDISNYSNHLVCDSSACPTYSNSGRYHGAFVYDGANDLFSSNQSSTFESQSLTIESWIYLDPTANARSAIVSYGQGTEVGGTAATESYALLYQTDIGSGIGSFRVRLRNSGGNSIVDLYSDGSSPSTDVYGQWVHVVTTWDGTTAIIYQNGVQVLSSSGSGTINYVSDSNSKLRIGNWFGNNERWFKGSIDEVNIYSEALSSDEVLQHYRSSLNKLNSTHYFFYTNQTNLPQTNYTFAACYENLSSSEFCTNAEVTLDQTAPFIYLSSPSNDSYTSSSHNFTFSAVDSNIVECALYVDLATEYSNSSMLNNTTTTALISSLSEGSHNWNVACQDQAGNINISQLRYFTTDSIAPSINLISPSNNSMFAGSSIDLSFSFSQVDNLSSTSNCSLLLDGSSVASNSSVANSTNTTLSATGISVGSHSWYVSCTDLAGNAANSSTYYFEGTGLAASDGSSSSSSGGSRLSVSLDMQCNNNTITTSVSSVSVNVVDENTGSSVYSGTTDSDGHAMFNSCGRNVRVYANRDGYRSTDERFTLDSCTCLGTEVPPVVTPQVPTPQPTPTTQPAPPLTNTTTPMNNTPAPTPQPTPAAPVFTGPASGVLGSTVTFSVTNCEDCSVRVEGPDGRIVTLTVTNGAINLPITASGNYRLSLVRNGEVVRSLSMAATSPTNVTPSPSAPPVPGESGDNGFAILIIIILAVIGGVAYYYMSQRR